MRGSRQAAIRPVTSDVQNQARTLSRHRRVKIARAAHTTLVKVDQWGRGGVVGAELAAAIEKAVQAAGKKK